VHRPRGSYANQVGSALTRLGCGQLAENGGLYNLAVIVWRVWISKLGAAYLVRHSDEIIVGIPMSWMAERGSPTISLYTTEVIGLFNEPGGVETGNTLPQAGGKGNWQCEISHNVDLERCLCFPAKRRMPFSLFLSLAGLIFELCLCGQVYKRLLKRLLAILWEGPHDRDIAAEGPYLRL
jgi:hypothetical protein